MPQVCEAVDRDKYIELLRRKIHILKLEWDSAAKLGKTCQTDNDDVEARLVRKMAITRFRGPKARGTFHHRMRKFNLCYFVSRKVC